ncbi:TonB-dependent siderophore receptor [Terrihabitans rhizophilus]|uniref:TonB-dependent siderophore receptor n=1 Tax=Terrihabitans rhizophilus TaxID=3092662 RepID=A0ABU4RVP4_9HYPH|nr:TonB-dependent siderophore receptor [Terrihabitans sp. PJ23]MDX6806941.1 TonB-dependent siderophore receptor [Terrihabitans sp. PJ23]
MAQQGTAEIELETIVVQGEGEPSSTSASGIAVERANGPVDGFVATRSATGTKTDTPITETPQSISVVSQDQIETLGAQNPSEALRYTAGVQVERFGADPRYDWIKVRGIDVPSYLDGLLLPNSTYATPRYEPFGVERVEVLKGPASILYGQSPPGGLVNFVSKRPLEETQREVRFQVGSYDRFQGAFDFTGAMNDDKSLLYRIVGLGRLSDTEVDFVNDDRAFIAPSFTWKPTDDTSLTFLSHYIKDDAKSLQFLPSQGTLTPNPNGQIPRNRFLGEPGFDDFKREEFGLGYEFEHRFSESLTFRQNLRYTEVDVNLPVVRGFGFGASCNPVEPTVAGCRNVTRRTVIFDDKIDAFTVDNQLLWETRTGPVEHQFLAGIDVRDLQSRFSTTTHPLGAATATPIDIFDPVYGGSLGVIGVTGDVSQDILQTGIYLQDQIRFDRFILMLSGRHDWVDNRFTNVLTGAAPVEQDDREFTGRAGLVVELDHGFSPYVSYSTSFQPTVNIGFSGGVSGPVVINGEPFEPTKGEQVEAGVKYVPLGTNSLFTASVFNLKQDNLVVGTGVTTSQIGEVEINGFEFEGKMSLARGWDLLASYSYLDAEIVRGVQSGIDISGNDLPVTPEHQAALFASYTWDGGPLSGLMLGGGVRYFGDHTGNTLNNIDIPSYTLVDAVARYDLANLDNRLKGATVSVNASNLFDKDYVATCGDVNTCYYGNGRTVLGTVSYRW